MDLDDQTRYTRLDDFGRCVLMCINAWEDCQARGILIMDVPFIGGYGSVLARIEPDVGQGWGDNLFVLRKMLIILAMRTTGSAAQPQQQQRRRQQPQ